LNNNKSIWRTRILNIIKFIVTASLLYYIFYRYININDFLTAFSNIMPELLFVLLVIIFAYRYLFAYQTSYYFKKVFDIELGINFVFKVQLVSSFYGLILPGDLAGGLITWYMVSDKSGEKAASASVIIFLRLLSIIALIVFTAIGLVFEENLMDIDLRVYIILLAVLCLLMFIPFVSLRAATIMKQFSISIIKIIPVSNLSNKLAQLSNKLWDSVITCTNVETGVILYTVLMSILCHLFLILFTYLLMIMVGINLPFYVSVWLLGLVNLVQLLPVSFAGLGVRDISVIYLLDKSYQVAPESSMILSTFFLAFGLIFILMGGIAIWFKPSGCHQMKGEL